MRTPNARLVAQMQQKISDGFYADTANILQDANPSLDVFGQPTSVSVTTTSVSCSFTDKPKVEKWQGHADISMIAAEIRYEGTPAPAKGNRVTLTGRFDGTGYVDNTFEVIGIQDRDAFGYVCALMKVGI